MKCKIRGRMTEEQRQLASDPVMVGLAGNVVRLFMPRWSQIQDDLSSAAISSIVYSAMSYDPSLGACFRTYALHRMRGACLDEIRRCLGQGISGTTYVVRSGRQVVVHSLHRQIGYDEYGPVYVADILRSRDPSPCMSMEDSEADRSFSEMLVGVPPREREIFRLLYVEGLSMKAAGEKVGLHESRVSQVHAYHLAALRQRHGVGEVA